MRVRVLSLMALVAALAACKPGAVVIAPITVGDPGGGAALKADGASLDAVLPDDAAAVDVVEGTVRLPSSLVAAGSMNLVAAGSMNLVAAGSMNLIAAGGMNLVAAGSMNLVAAGSMNLVAAGSMNYRLFDIKTEAREGVVVFLCDATGEPVPGLKPVVTDATGKYRLTGAPAGYTLAVNALVPFEDNKRALLSSLVHTGASGPVDVDAATTLVSVRAMAGRGSNMAGAFNRDDFERAAGIARQELRELTTPDFRETAQVSRYALSLERALPNLRERLAHLRGWLATDTKLPPGMRPLKTATPTPQPTATPAVSRTPTPVTAPLPTPRPVPSQTPYAAPTAKPDVIYLPGPTAVPSVWTNPDAVNCTEPKMHTFKPKELGVARVVFRVRQPNDPNRANWTIRATAPLDASGLVTVPVALPEGCSFAIDLQTSSGQLINSHDNYTVPIGSQDPVPLPI